MSFKKLNPEAVGRGRLGGRHFMFMFSRLIMGEGHKITTYIKLKTCFSFIMMANHGSWLFSILCKKIKNVSEILRFTKMPFTALIEISLWLLLVFFFFFALYVFFSMDYTQLFYLIDVSVLLSNWWDCMAFVSSSLCISTKYLVDKRRQLTWSHWLHEQVLIT